ncbi:MAG: hypothetical protein HOP29_04155 [Phycisphaerales bacterium]|nr:hypothetical protein [Phycisphaerales bacterium]
MNSWKLLGIVVAAASLMGSAGCPNEGGTGGGGDATTMKVIAGLEYYAEHGCAACHCNNGQGACNLNAANIQDATEVELDENLRAMQTAGAEAHPLKVDASDEEIENLALFLGTLSGSVDLEGESQITKGYNLYVRAECIQCHLSSAQGAAEGGLGQAIAGTDPDNIYYALTGVECHPRQRTVPDQASEACTLPIATNATVQDLTDTAPPDSDTERIFLAYFLAFISPPPSGGFVEECENVPGEVCTVAGNGVSGYTLDDITATASLLYSPLELELTDWNVDGVPDLGIVDWNNHRIRLVYLDVETEGVVNRIISIAGTGKVTGDDALNHATDLAFDGTGALVMANWHNQNMYRYARGLVNGGDRDQLAGLCDLSCGDDSGGATRVDETFLSLPTSVAIHPDGRIFFAEGGCSRIRILTLGTGPDRQQPAQCITPVNLWADSMIETFAGAAGMNSYAPVSGTGPVSEALFNIDNSPLNPNFGISFTPENQPNYLVVADTKNNCIRRIDMTVEPPTIELVAGVPGMAGLQDGPGATALFNFPTNVKVHTDGDMYVADARNHVVRRIDADTLEVTTIAGTGQAGFNGDNRPALETQLNLPNGVAIHPDGRVFIADTNNNRIRVVNP